MSKRQLVLALFIALQSWKLYEWLIEVPSALGRPGTVDLLDMIIAFLVKWAAIELGLLAGLYWAKISKFRWSVPTSGAIWVCLCMVNVMLVLFGSRGGPSLYKANLADQASIYQAIIVDDVAGSKENLIRGIIYYDDKLFSFS